MLDLLGRAYGPPDPFVADYEYASSAHLPALMSARNFKSATDGEVNH